MREHTHFSTAIWSAGKILLSLLQRLCNSTPKLICVCRHSNPFPEVKVSREFSNSFLKAGTMLVCYCLWYFTHHPSLGRAHSVILAMGDSWKTKSFHLLLKIVCTDEIQLFMRKTLSKTSYMHPLKLDRMNIPVPLLNWWYEKRINLCVRPCISSVFWVLMILNG